MTEQDHERTTISYQAVPPGLPVITHDGEQFGVVEHVLQVPELDLFDGIVVYTGPAPGAGRPACSRSCSAARTITGSPSCRHT